MQSKKARQQFRSFVGNIKIDNVSLLKLLLWFLTSSLGLLTYKTELGGKNSIFAFNKLPTYIGMVLYVNIPCLLLTCAMPIRIQKIGFLPFFLSQ